MHKWRVVEQSVMNLPETQRPEFFQGKDDFLNRSQDRLFRGRNFFPSRPFANLHRLHAHLRLALPIGSQGLVRFQWVNAYDRLAQQLVSAFDALSVMLAQEVEEFC